MYRVQRLNDNGGWRHYANAATLKGARTAAKTAKTETRILDKAGAVVKPPKEKGDGE